MENYDENWLKMPHVSQWVSAVNVTPQVRHVDEAVNVQPCELILEQGKV